MPKQMDIQTAFFGKRKREESREAVKFVDFFAGVGGATQGAVNAGLEPYLAVDSWNTAVTYHARNFPNAMHRCLKLRATDTVDSLDLPLPKNCNWHLHLSPPCQKLSEMNTYDRSRGRQKLGMAMVEWSINFALSCGASTFSFEQVPDVLVINFLEEKRREHPSRIDYEVFNFEDFSVPQTRKRVIAGTPYLIRRLRRLRNNDPLMSIASALPDFDAAYIRNETLYACAKGNPKRRRLGKFDMIRDLSLPSFCVVAFKPLRAVYKNPLIPMRRLTTQESAALQTFPAGYMFPKGVTKSIRLVGNAFTPKVAELLLQGVYEM
jgi:site-specific DNA-cytosine methylase